MSIARSVPIRLRRRRSPRRSVAARPGRRRLATVRVAACAAGRRTAATFRSHRLIRQDVGQATAEYALVLLGAAAVALMLTAWAARSGAIGDLFDAIVDQLIAKAA